MVEKLFIYSFFLYSSSSNWNNNNLRASGEKKIPNIDKNLIINFHVKIISWDEY